ncbi:DUF6578 domain-containing protein [Microbacterium testaceum]|uniref:DUF6578 domain-containing protein n=1 Tax=Microbacterium testaceum TaxID=2033 RepID=UPI001246C0BD|nr:DUF6578 domain-containing protein [Microbacterium testaceum]
MTRVWLDATEWACCGDPFSVGDDVDFVIDRWTPSAGFVRSLGAELSATVDAFEARHPEGPTDDRVRGRVTNVRIVVQESIDRFDLRRPGHGAPADAEMPAEGEPWPFSGRDLGNGFLIGTRPSRWVLVSEPVPGAVELVPSDTVPGERPESGEVVSDDDLDGPEPAEQRRRVRRGWLVDVDETDL